MFRLRRLVFLISWKTTSTQMVVYHSELTVLRCSSGTIVICPVFQKKKKKNRRSFPWKCFVREQLLLNLAHLETPIQPTAYTIGTIFKHITNYVQLYFTNGFTNIVLSTVNCLWLVGITLIFDGSPQIIVKRCQIEASRWLNDISSVADSAIFKNRSQNIEYSFGCT